MSKNPLFHFTGIGGPCASRPLVIVSPPLPLPNLFFQPKPGPRDCPFGFGTAVFRCAGSGAVGFAEGVAAGNQCDDLFVVHSHAAERFPNVSGQRADPVLPFGPSGST